MADSLLHSLARHLELEVVGPLAGGEFGAIQVADRDGRSLVLKALQSERWADIFARGASIANWLRAQGYPAPEYVGTGAALGATWSLQAWCEGEVPERVGPAHMRQLVELAGRHAGAGRKTTPWFERQLPWLQESLETILANPLTRPLALELRDVLAEGHRVMLLEDGVVHGDFHHRNFLAIGDDVATVFDWEFASSGDWRYDVVTLAFWSLLAPQHVAPDVAALVVERMFAVCPADVLALLAAVRAVTQLDFDARAHPEFLPGMTAGIEARIAPWWRGA